MSDGPAGSRGKWSQSGVPHKGWRCINSEDLSEPSLRCQMCESSEIRYVHYMEHDGYPGILACGVVCAGNMEQDLLRARVREQLLAGSARRRAHFPKRRGWHLNRKSNPQIKVGAFTITMFRKANGWGGVVNHPQLENGVFTRERFPDLVSAQGAAFDTLVILQEEL
jgi:hypothetical protein